MQKKTIKRREGVFFSPDGTNIEFFVVGSGPKVLLIHGSTSYPADRDGVSNILSKHFTVYCPDRRGWANSGGQGKDYSMEKECEDMIGLMKEHQIEYVFALESGCLVALHTILRFSVRKLVLVEPCLVSLMNTKWIARAAYEREKGKTIDALITYTKSESRRAKYIPRFVLSFIFKRAPSLNDDLEFLNNYFRFAPQELSAAYEVEDELAGLNKLDIEVLTVLHWDDNKGTYASADRIMELIKNCQRIVIDLEGTCPKRKNNILSDFLSSVLSFFKEEEYAQEEH